MATPSNFTYGLGNPKVTTITKPGQTLPTTKKVVPKGAVDSKEVKAVKDAQAAVDAAFNDTQKLIEDFINGQKTGAGDNGFFSGGSAGLT
jgi:hypothetical protein